MTTDIKIKRSGSAGSPNTLRNGELAYSYLPGDQSNGGDRLYVGTGTEDSNNNSANIETIGGKYFTDLLNHVHGTLPNNGAIITNSTGGVNTLKGGNLTISGNNISGSATDTNITIVPNGAGNVGVNNSRVVNLAEPVMSTDAVTKNYVDNAAPNLSLSVSADSGSSSLSLGTDSLAITGGSNIRTGTNNDDTVSVNLNTNLTGITRLELDNLVLDGDTLSTTSGPLILNPFPSNDSGEVIIRGDLTVHGTTTTINSVELSINDLVIVLADSAQTAEEAEGAGFHINGADANFKYNATNNRFISNIGVEAPLLVGTLAGLDSDLGSTSTSSLPEGSNLYFTDERVDNLINTRITVADGIAKSYSNNILTIRGANATTTSKGVASFTSDNFGVDNSLGTNVVAITTIDGGVYSNI